MFDPLTTQLIRSAPPLNQLDLERLPQALTQAFTAIVGFRVQMAQAGGPLPDALRNQLDQFRRLANTFESLVILLPNRENRAAAAYVAGQAHHLLHMARQLEPSTQNVQLHLRAEAISPVVSALLLFLVADQPSDAMELAKSLRAPGPEGSTVEQRLVEALALLAEGRPQSILELAAPDFPQQDNVETEAVQALFFRLWEGLRILSSRLSPGTEASISGESPEGIFRQVQELAVGEIEPLPESALADYAGFRALATYAGPHHLAALLIPAAARLQECATANVRNPPGTNAARWATLRDKIVRQRPFLWRNHRDAVTQGLLEPGTSAVVSFPTGAGKTTLSELKIASTLAADGAVLYLAPTHALVSQVKRSLQQTFTGVVVGDSLVSDDFYVEVGEDSLAEIAVMTPERCLALLSITPQMFQRVGLVIFDECHLLHPQSPGRTRRSVDAMLAVLHLARVAPQADWLLLSAMMSNADELAGWLAQITGRRCLALKLDWKPTRQARGCLVFEQNELDRLQKLVEMEQTKSANENGGDVPNPPKRVQSLFQAKPFGFFCLEQTWQSTKFRDYALQPLLEESVSFTVAKPQNKSRWHLNPNKSEVAAQLAARCAERGLRVLLFGQTIDTTAKLAHLIEQRLLSRVKTDKLAAGEEKLRQWICLEVGSAEAQYLPVHQLAGCHHGDMLPVERELVERLFRRTGGICALAATTTLAQGVNLPADIVFIVGDARYDATDKKSKMMDAHELLNAAGRAGRAGQVAQGLVVVLPNYTVGFDRKRGFEGNWWKNLRQGIFSKPDQCLRIQDPVQAMLDMLQDSTQQGNPDLAYFLRRIPPPTSADADAPAKFLRSSFAAYHARQAKTEATFEAKLQSAIARRAAEVTATGGATWEAELASRIGVNFELIEQLNRDLQALTTNRPFDTEGWLRWFCSWLGQCPARRKALLRHRMNAAAEDSKQLDLFGDRLFEVTWAWMSGESLQSLAIRLGANPKKLGKCSVARDFVIRRIPEIAYAVGLATQVYREQLDREIAVGKMPVALATVSLCVRMGQRNPEGLALRLELKTPHIARLSVQEISEQCSAHIEPGCADEPFARTRARVAASLALLRESGRSRSLLKPLTCHSSG